MTRTHVANVLAVLATALLMAIGFTPRHARGQSTALAAGSIGVSVLSLAPGDSARFRARWTPGCDAGGCPDSALITWVLNGVAQPTRGLKARGDTVWTMRTVCPGVTTATASIVQMRRGRPSAPPLVRSATMGCRDVAPPPPDSFAIDTGFVWRGAVRVDSFPAKHVADWADAYRVHRGDGHVAMVTVLRDWRTAAVLGAHVTAATTCPDSTRWITGDTVSVPLAQARASQWPQDSLTGRTTRGWLALDTRRWPAGAAWQQGCD